MRPTINFIVLPMFFSSIVSTISIPSNPSDSFISTTSITTAATSLNLTTVEFLDLIGRVNTEQYMLEYEQLNATVLQKRSSVPSEYTREPYYPAPPGGWVREWKDAYVKAAAIVSQMTLAEKVNLTTGTGIYMGPCSGNTGSAPRFGIRNFCLEDSALGVALTGNVTAFPAGITIGATWNKDLMYSRGAALAAEARGKGVNVQLGPTIGPLGRKPRGGRNWEGFGADPVLQAWGGAQTIKGMQSQGVIACAKHYIGNEQERYRMDDGLLPALSSNIEDRQLHELYLWSFAEAVRAEVGSVMTSYNDVNGSKASQNSLLINGILKDELGFQGFVMSDWFAQRGGVSSALAGLDMAMPGDAWVPLLGNAYWAYELSTSILNGTVPLPRLNDMVTRIVATWYKMGQDEDYPDINFSSYTEDATGSLYPVALNSPTGIVNRFVNVQSDHNIVARQVAREGITLLKNEDGILPLKNSTPLQIFGADAANDPDGINSCDERACNDGILGMGWGSGTANYPYLVSPVEAIGNRSTDITTHISNTFPSNITVTDDDIAIVFINSDSGEGSDTVHHNYGDRTYDGLDPWNNGSTLVQEAAAKFSAVIVVVHTVGPILMEDWIDMDTVKAVLFAHLPGQEAGTSLADILYGDYSPSGHLPYSLIKSEDDYPESVSLDGADDEQVQDTFSEGLYIDYRYLNKEGIAPRYAFGHGLSYTKFSYTATISTIRNITSAPPNRTAKSCTPSYNTSIPAASEVAYPSDLDIMEDYLYPYLDNPENITASSDFDYPTGYSTTPHAIPIAGGSQGGNPALWDIMFNVTVTVINTGNYTGKAVVQLYAQALNTTVEMPTIQLRAFEKTRELNPGSSQSVVLSLTRKDLSYWDVVRQNWIIPTKSWKFWIGDSSANLTLVCGSASASVCTDGNASPV
ncbi:MAG: hypothetical protein M1834_007066 [Cirrosporium novae-zelandiae]|nr:MAG: hypothetical protein M1834_007066 [Cirrosporium novae-zelandiae]